jgi:hypothetical protein
MRLISILVFVIFPLAALAQGAGNTGGPGGTPGASGGSVLPAPTGHRQPRAADVPANQGGQDSVQRLQGQKDRIDSKTTGSICSNC